MGWVCDVVTSEFVWGVVIGLFLALVVAGASVWLDKRQKRGIALDLCGDLISNICKLIQDLDDHRRRNNNINHELLELILAEIHIFGRNREHIILISDTTLRSDIRDFFTRVAALLAQTQWHLQKFYETNSSSQNELATLHLTRAREACDQLSGMKTHGQDIAQRSTST